MAGMLVRKAFGETLADMRQRAGLSRPELARASRLDRSFIWMLERGHHEPSIGKVLRLARALGTSAEELMRLVERRLAGTREPRRVKPARR